MPERCVVARHPSVARQSKIQASSQTVAPDGGNHGKRKVLHAVQECLSRPRKIACRYSPNRRDLRKISASDKRAGVCGNHHALEKTGAPDFVSRSPSSARTVVKELGIRLRRKGEHGNRIVAGKFHAE